MVSFSRKQAEPCGQNRIGPRNGKSDWEAWQPGPYILESFFEKHQEPAFRLPRMPSSGELDTGWSPSQMFQWCQYVPIFRCDHRGHIDSKACNFNFIRCAHTLGAFMQALAAPRQRQPTFKLQLDGPAPSLQPSSTWKCCPGQPASTRWAAWAKQALPHQVSVMSQQFAGTLLMQCMLSAGASLLTECLECTEARWQKAVCCCSPSRSRARCVRFCAPCQDP